MKLRDVLLICGSIIVAGLLIALIPGILPPQPPVPGSVAKNNDAPSPGSEKKAATGKADSFERDSSFPPRKLRTRRTIMKVLALGLFAKPLTDEQKKRMLPKEVPDTLRLYLDGKIDQFWFREDKPGGVVFLVNSTSVEEARSIVEALPLAANGYLVFEYIPVGPLQPLGLLIKSPQPE
jgi:hypothetical protein